MQKIRQEETVKIIVHLVINTDALKTNILHPQSRISPQPLLFLNHKNELFIKI